MRNTTACLSILLGVCGNLWAQEKDEKQIARGKILDRNGVVLARTDAEGLRAYPFGALAAQTLGYNPGKKGKTGIEFGANDRLVKGENVSLTIDVRIQLAAERAMRKVGRGAAVVIDPSNGEILAMVSVPSFDPNLFSPAISEKNWKPLANDATAPMLNRAVHAYAPASAFKVISALAQPKEKIAPEKIVFPCEGSFDIGQRSYKCWIFRRGRHGDINLQQAIAQSCNAFFYQHGLACGIEEINRVGQVLGLEKKTGIPLRYEAAGLIPDPEYIAEKRGDQWGDSHTANVVIGQGDTQATPLQMAAAIAALGNGKDYFQPRLVLGRMPKATNLTKNGIPQATIDIVRQGLWDVVNSEQGTARRARIADSEVAGKTGTAQFKRQGVPDNHAWFVGYVPHEKPRFAICVFVQGGKSGGSIAAPIARMILAESLALPAKPAEGESPVEKLEPAVGSFAPVDVIEP